MSKKFSTLMAGLLLAGAFSTNVYAQGGGGTSTTLTAGVDAKVEKGDYVRLALDGTPSNTLGIGAKNVLESQTVAEGDLDEIHAQLWQVASIKYNVNTGVPTYQFINKVTGQYLAINLKTDNKGASTSAVVLNGAGNKDWAFSGGVLYAFANDSIYTLYKSGSELRLQAKKGSANDVPTAATKLYIARDEDEIALTANMMNSLLATNKFYFNDEDVSEGQTNILTEKKWVAYAEKNGVGFFLAEKDKETSINKNPYLLMVDTVYQAKSLQSYFALTVDTLSLPKQNAGNLKKGIMQEKNYKTFSTVNNVEDKFVRPINSALLNASYTLYNDSISLIFKSAPAKSSSNEVFFAKDLCTPDTTTREAVTVALTELASTKVLTVTDDVDGYIVPLIQPYATTNGDATIDGNGKVYFMQIAVEPAEDSGLRAATLKGKYLALNNASGDPEKEILSEVDPANVYAQWGFIEGAAGSYQIVNRGTGDIVYTGAINKATDAKGKEIANTYVIGNETIKLIAVDLSGANIVEEKGVKYDYTGAFFAGSSTGLSLSFQISPASQYLTQLAAQFNKDSVLVLGEAETAPVWYFEAGTPEVYGAEIPGLPALKKVTYKIYTQDADGNKYYVWANGDKDYAITKSDSEYADDAAVFELRTISKDVYLFLGGDEEKMTINPTPKQPVLEVSDITSERNDYFTIVKTVAGIYRKLTAEDGVLGNAKIFMQNETNRYLYENSQNIVANNGTGLNFLGIYNTAELTKNAALYVDTAYVEREGVYMWQYMLGLGVEEVEAQDAIACTYSHNHYDNEGNKVDALHCSHATPATEGYKTGRYLVALNDSVPENGSKNHPTYFDGSVRLAFVPAIHYLAEDTIVIANSKFSDTDEAASDTLKIADNELNAATFALLIKDQETKSFYLENANGYVRILNGVPVLTDDIEDAAVFNIEATTEEATANEAIAAEGVQVIGGKGAVTVQGAAGKVITVANILGQTIANQVAASDNVTIAVPAGIVVVAVEGDATKVVVK